MSNPYPLADCDSPEADCTKDDLYSKADTNSESYDSDDSDDSDDSYGDMPELIELNTSQMTCVTGLWDLEDTYDKCLENTLQINCPYVFFGDKRSIEYAKQFRGDYPTYYIEYNINEFNSYKYINKTIIDDDYCKSLEINLIWHEKINMINKAASYNIFGSEYFCWIDADIDTYKNSSPPSCVFPNTVKLHNLPKDKFIFSSDGEYDEDKVYYIWNYHYISGVSYIMHKNIIKDFTEQYQKYMEKLIDNNNLWTDRVILTQMYKDNKELFYKLSEYDINIVPLLY